MQFGGRSGVTVASERVDLMATFLSRFRSLANERRSGKTAAVAAFLEEFRRQLASPVGEQRFNMLDLVGVGSDEVKHSSILAWLLTPHGSHGCGPLFLRTFLAASGIHALLSEDFVGSRVRTEFAGNDSIIDILVYKPATFVLYIENKVFAAEGPRQVDREFADMVRFGGVVRVPRDRMFPVFLTPSGRPPTSGEPDPWQCVSYARLARDLDELSSSLPAKTKYFVEDLVDQYRKWSTA